MPYSGVRHLTHSISVIVNFRDHHDSKVPPREVWVAESEFVPIRFAGRAYESAPSARLSQLLPVAIESDSPIKGKPPDKSCSNYY